MDKGLGVSDREQLSQDDAASLAELSRLQAEAAEAEAQAALARAAAARLRAEALQLEAKEGMTPRPPSRPQAERTPPPRRHTAVADKSSADSPAADDAGAERSDGQEGHRMPRHFLRAALACSSSMLVHLALIVALGLWMLPGIVKPQFRELTATLDETPPEVVNQVLDERLTPTTELALVSSSRFAEGSRQDGRSAGVVGISQPKYDRAVAESVEGPRVNVEVLDIYQVGGRELSSDLPDGTLGEPLAVVDDYQEAMDRITQEILNMLARSKVLVIWCFDQSLSMKDDQQEVRQRIDRVYAELGLHESAQGDALLTAVTSYGQGVMQNTHQPTSDVEKIRAAIASVPVDESGLEMMCQAVGESILHFRKYATSGRRQVALILVTDESGDTNSNAQYLEDAIAAAREAHCPIYTLGREAVFGYPYAHMWWTVTLPAVGGGTASQGYLVRVDRGPETPFVEQLQTDGFGRRQDAHPSGFGPYEQVRMASQTGGIFFMLPSPEINLFQRDNRKYELEKMRPYLPDLRRRDVYGRERDGIPLRGGIAQVINDLNPWNEERGKYINLRTTFSVDPAAFIREVAAEQEKTKQYVLYLHAVEKALEEIRAAREQEVSPRWQANYDLMFAQVIAYKVRLYEYGAYLDHFMRHPKKVPPNEPKNVLGSWAITTRQETVTGDLTRRYIQRSKLMFEDVVRYHPGTPWAARAQWELQRGFGVELVPQYYDPTYKPPVPVTPFVEPKL